MYYKYSAESGVATITIGRDGFDLKTVNDFRLYASEALASSAHCIEIDLTNVRYLDSAVMGALLMIKEQARWREVVITHVGDSVRELLDIACFNKIFKSTAGGIEQI